MSRARRAHALAAGSAVAQYVLAYGVGVPIFAVYRVGRRLRRRTEPDVPARAP